MHPSLDAAIAALQKKLRLVLPSSTTRIDDTLPLKNTCHPHGQFAPARLKRPNAKRCAAVRSRKPPRNRLCERGPASPVRRLWRRESWNPRLPC